jgi:hypothetical protein
MNKITLSLIAIFAILALSNCKKKTEEPVPAPSRSTLIVKSWVLTGATASPAVNGLTNVYFLLPPCDADDQYIFKADKTIEVQEGSSTACKNGKPATEVKNQGTWSFNTDESKLTFKAGLFNIQADILEMSATQMKLRTDASAFATLAATYNIIIPSGTKADLTFTAQ